MDLPARMAHVLMSSWNRTNLGIKERAEKRRAVLILAL